MITDTPSRKTLPSSDHRRTVYRKNNLNIICIRIIYDTHFQPLVILTDGPNPLSPF